MEQILVAYGLPKETVIAIMMLSSNTKVKIHSPDGDIDFFDIVAGVLWRDTLAPYLFIICLDYVLRMLIDLIKENGFTLKNSKKQTISHRNYYRHRLCRWHCASWKYTYPSQISTAWPGAGSRKHWALCEYRKNRVHVFLSRRYEVPSISFQIFLHKHLKFSLSWKFTMLLLYILWDDWPIFMISHSNEHLQQQLEYTLLKPHCHCWGI